MCGLGDATSTWHSLTSARRGTLNRLNEWTTQPTQLSCWVLPSFSFEQNVSRTQRWGRLSSNGCWTAARCITQLRTVMSAIEESTRKMTTESSEVMSDSTTCRVGRRCRRRRLCWLATWSPLTTRSTVTRHTTKCVAQATLCMTTRLGSKATTHLSDDDAVVNRVVPVDQDGPADRFVVVEKRIPVRFNRFSA